MMVFQMSSMLPAPITALFRNAPRCEAYRARALAVHPDKTTHARATEAFQQLSAAYEELSARLGRSGGSSSSSGPSASRSLLTTHIGKAADSVSELSGPS